MLDKMKDLLVLALIVALLASVLSFVLSMVLAPLYEMIGFQAILSALIGLVLLIWIGMETGLDEMKFFEIIVLFVAVGLVGSIITTVLPAVAPYIISLENFANLTSITWSLVYVGLAMAIKEKFL